MYVRFVDIAELGDIYSRSAKMEPIHSYLVERWQSLLTLECKTQGWRKKCGILS